MSLTKANKPLKNIFLSVLIGLIIAGLFSAAVFVLASHPFTPGETLDPDCSPGDTDCSVSAAVPYTGATDSVNLGSQTLTTTGAATLGSLTLTTDLAVAHGGTGASTAAAARTNLGLVIGTDVQAYDAGLADLAGLAVTDGNIIVGDGANWVAESGATARTSLGLGTGDSPQFTSIELGHATDTTLSRSAAGAVDIEGVTVATASNTLTLTNKTISGGTLSGTTTYTNAGAGSNPTLASNSASQLLSLTGSLDVSGALTLGTDLAVAHGGTGASTAAAARTNLGAAASGANTDIDSVTLDNTGLAIADTNASHNLTIAPGSDLTAARTFTLTTGDADRTLDLGANLTIPADPNADRILFWDDSAGATAYLTAGAGLTISGTTMTASGGGDSVTVNSTAADTTANFLDNLYIDFSLADGGAGGPDDVTGKFNYAETLAGNPALGAGECIFTTDGTGGGILCEGSTADTIEGLIQWAPTTSDRTITLPDASDTLVGRATTDTLTNKTLDSANNTFLNIDHGSELTGLTDDDHTIYALLAGRSGGQNLIGGTGSGDDLTLTSTSNATKGSIILENSIKHTVTSLTGATTLSDTHNIISADATSGAFTITLPALSGNQGLVYDIVKVDSSANAITIDANGIETITSREGNNATIVLYLQGDHIRIVADETTLTDTWQVVTYGLTPHTAGMSRAAAQSIPNNSITKIQFDTEDFDIGGIADSTTNYEFAIKRAGRYLVTAYVSFPGVMDDAEHSQPRIHINGTAELIHTCYSPALDFGISCTLSNIFSLAAGDTVQLHVLHNEGADQNTATAEQEAKLTIEEIL